MSKTVLLTGSSSGMGKIIAQELALQGHVVFAAMRNMTSRNAQHAQELSAFAAAHAITPVEIDVTDDASVRHGVNIVLAAAGHIDVLINCAGVMWTGTTEAFGTDQFLSMLQTNLIGPFRLFKAVLPGMRAAGEGLLITITSTCGRIIPPNFGIYSASKFGLEALAEAIGYETVDLGIQTVILEPGPFATSLLANQVAPCEHDITAQYGAMGAFDSGLAEAMNKLSAEHPEEFDPQIVADAVVEIIAQPKEARPFRRPLGRSKNVAELNGSIAKVQAEFLGSVGLGHLAAHIT